MMPIATVATHDGALQGRDWPMVSQRAETASGTAITLDSAPIPTIDPMPTTRRNRARPRGWKLAIPRAPKAAAEPAMPCINPTKSVRQRKPCACAWSGAGMRHVSPDMAVRVNVDRSSPLIVFMKMHPYHATAPKHMRAEADQHDADRSLQRLRENVQGSNGRGDCRCRQPRTKSAYGRPPKVKPLFDYIDDMWCGARRCWTRRRYDRPRARAACPTENPTQNSEHVLSCWAPIARR